MRETVRHAIYVHFLKGAGFALASFARATNHFLPAELKSAIESACELSSERVNPADLTRDDFPVFDRNGHLPDVEKALFGRDHLGVKLDRETNADLERLAEAIRACPLCWMYESFCVVVETPRVIRTEPSPPGRLHCEDGPAVAYADGFSVYCLRGLCVPKAVIEDRDSLTLSFIRDQVGGERWIFMERYGFARYLEDVRCEVLDQATVNGQRVRLLSDGGTIEGSTNNGAEMLIVEVTGPEGTTYQPAILDVDDRSWKLTCKNALKHVIEFDGY